MNDQALRQEVIDTALKMNALGINQGMSGNVSVRVDDGLLITPSGRAYEDLTPADIVFMDRDGQPSEGQKPSSEWRFHLDIYAGRPDIQAVVHTHSVHATALACQHKGIPAFHYMVAAAGGKDVRCASYALFGTQELSDLALAALEDRMACLLAHHGVIATGTTLTRALDLAQEIETLAAQYIKVLQLGEAKLLSDAEMDDVLTRFQSYGANA